MNNLQRWFITNNIDDTFFNNDDFDDIGNPDYSSFLASLYISRVNISI